MQSPPSRTTVEQKIKARNCALLLKNGSPKLRDLLREKCRTKMKESRADAFFSSRNIPVEKRQLINTIVGEELAFEIDNDIQLQEIILKEILDNWECWQNEEYERAMEFMISGEEEIQVFCPVCEKNTLRQEQENIISCNCGLRLYYSKTLLDFYEKIQSSLKMHETLANCQEKLQFYAEPKVAFNVLGLNAFCAACDYFVPILELI